MPTFANYRFFGSLEADVTFKYARVTITSFSFCSWIWSWLFWFFKQGVHIGWLLVLRLILLLFWHCCLFYWLCLLLNRLRRWDRLSWSCIRFALLTPHLSHSVQILKINFFFDESTFLSWFCVHDVLIVLGCLSNWFWDNVWIIESWLLLNWITL